MRKRIQQLWFLCCIMPTLVAQNNVVEAQELVKRGFKTPHYETHFTSEQLFSVADIGARTFQIKYPKTYKMTRPAPYRPKDEATGSPMFQVTAPAVIIDFNGTKVKKAERDLSDTLIQNCVGIEIGYSPTQLAADPTLVQPENVVIRNGGLEDFDIGIVIHTGVRSVRIENMTISNAVLGIACLGLPEEQGGRGDVLSCSFERVKILGNRQADRVALETNKARLDWAKAKCEVGSAGTGLHPGAQGFGYGANVVMPYEHNAVTNANTALSYYGVLFDNVQNMSMSDVAVSDLGWEKESVADVLEDSVTRPFMIRDSSLVFADHVEATSCASGLSTVGLSVDNSASCSFSHSTFSNLVTEEVHFADPASTQGLYTKVVDLQDCKAIKLQNCVGNNNQGVEYVYGLYAQDCDVIDVADFEFIYNRATHVLDGAVRGVEIHDSNAIDILRYIFEHNFGPSSQNASHGLFLDTVNTATCLDMSLSNNSLGNAELIKTIDVQNLTLERVQMTGNIINNNATVFVGIQFQTGSGDSGAASLSVKDVDISNVQILSDADFIGFDIIKGRGVVLENISMRNNETQAGSFSGVRFLQSIDTCDWKGGYFDANHTQGGNIRGIVIEQGEDVSFEDISVSNNEIRTGTGTLYGIEIPSTLRAFDVKGLYINANETQQGIVVGLYAETLTAAEFEDVVVDYNHAAQADAYGMRFVTLLHSCSMKNVSIERTVTEGDGTNAYGLYCHKGVDLLLQDISVSYTSAEASGGDTGGNAYGMYFNELHSAKFKDVYANAMYATHGDAYGVWSYAQNAVSVDGLSTQYNHADAVTSKAYGVAGVLVKSSDYTRVSADYNVAGEQAFGMYMIFVSALSISNTSAQHNQASNIARGITCTNGNTVRCVDCNTSNNVVTASGIADENTVQRTAQSKHLDSSQYGASGSYFADIQGLSCIRVISSLNSGFRAKGIVGYSLSDACFDGCSTSFQTATGAFFIDDAFDEDPGTSLPVDFEAMTISTEHAETFFGGIDASSLVDAVAATKDYLAGMHLLKFFTDESLFDASNIEEYAFRKQLVSAQLILRGVFAQYRRHGVAVGLQIHNSSHCTIKNHTAQGNNSLYDYAVGCAFTGINDGHYISQGSFAGQEAWKNSAEDASHAIFIGGIEQFIQGIGLQMLAAHNNDAVIALSTTVSQEQRTYNPASDGPADFATNRLAVYLDGQFTEYSSPICGIAAGILLGDSAYNIEIEHTVCADNVGNAGQAYGIMQDATSSLLVKDNIMMQNRVNAAGFAAGLAEYALQSNTIHANNIMYANAYDTTLNMNFLVPYDPENFAQLSFPVKRVYNGDFANMANKLAYDNLEIMFMEKRPVSVYVPNTVVQDWQDQSYIA